MKLVARLSVVAIVVAAVVACSSAVWAAGPQQSTAAKKQTTTRTNQWRYTFHNSEWWYWLPEGRWVYWRDSRWNRFDPKTYVAPMSPASQFAAGSWYAVPGSSGATADSDVYPFYGRTLGDLDRRVLQDNEETGPFYGHALPSEVFGPWRMWGSSRPAYGHAIPDGN
jgi:hypothetical protein